ncbi:hypothetical protein RND81_10G200000 [Saponaria officinalis]|uniref:Cytochrome P450 n=1 Tax=Saponaria officinalis TaxID=3572 RepID=A0AAW1I5M0_SAPOF
MSFTSIDIFLSFFVLLFFSFIIYNKFFTQYSATYGPPTYPFIGCLISFYQNRRRLLDWYTQLLTESPSQTIVVSRLGARKIIVTANPENVEYILKTNFQNFPKGQPYAELLGDLLGQGIFIADGELWATHRKLASHEFTTNSLREFVVKTLEDEVESRLFPLLHSAAKERKIIDLQEVLKRFTYDTICKVSLGTDPNCLDLSVEVPPLITAFETAGEISARRSTNPIYLIWKLKRVLNLGAEAKLKQSINMVHTLVKDIFHHKQKPFSTSKTVAQNPNPNNHDLLSRFLSAGYDLEMARDMVISFIMAGRDTTAAAMTWLFWLISSGNTSARDSIRAELGSSLGSGRLGYELVKREMRYLQACLCETMRLYPPVPWGSKHAANDDVLPDGITVKKGERVTYFPYGMGRMHKIWGNDWSKFNPDRWFENNKINHDPDQKDGDDNNNNSNSHRNLKMISPYVFPVFQAGPRICLGKEMAFLQMKYVVASIISRFDFEPVSNEPPVFVPLLTAHMAGGLRVRVKEIGVVS